MLLVQLYLVYDNSLMQQVQEVLERVRCVCTFARSAPTFFLETKYLQLV